MPDMDGMVLRDVVATRRRVSRKRVAMTVAGLVALSGVGWFAADWWSNGRFIETTDDAYVGGDVTAIAPHVAGFVGEILVGDNERVAAGQVLMRLDRRDFAVALERTRAVEAGREAALVSLEAQLVQQRAVVRQAEAEVRSRQSRAVFAVQDASRYASLAETSAASRQQQQKASSARDDAQATVAGGEAALAAATAEVAVLQGNVAGAQAGVDEARAAVRAAELDLGYTEIRSPIEGYVGNRAARVGAYVFTGAYLMSVIPASQLWVDANFKEDQLARLRPGQVVEVAADAAPGRALAGRIGSLAPGTGAVFSVIPPENATGNFTKIVQRVPVRIALEGGAADLGVLRPGLSVTVRVDTR